ncbi:MAG: metallophosphoesterase [Candidatus Brocadiia bacterium]
MAWHIYLLVAPLLGGLGLLVWMVLIEPRRFRVQNVPLPCRNGTLPPLRILHVTDTHLRGRDRVKLDFLRTLADAERFDLVFYTGDLIHCPDGIASLIEAVSLFEPRLGSYAVLGGHDYVQVKAPSVYWHMLTLRRLRWACRPNPVDHLIGQLEAGGVTVLSDQSARVECPDGRRLTLVGLRDAFQFEPDFESAWKDIERDEPVIVLAHSPDVLPEVVRRGAAAAFFGHTHGGQIRLPGMGALVTRTRMPRACARGVFRWGETSCVVNCGLGAAPATPFRLLCPPEVVVAELGRDGAPDLPELGVPDG